MLIKTASGPECPKCGNAGFDDWNHEPTLKTFSGIISGRLKCHGCGRFFSITHYTDGATHSIMKERK